MKGFQVYKQLYLPDHPRADYTGMVGEHIIIAEETIGRKLKEGEVIHHCDFDRLNNARHNLIVMTRLQHQQLPAFQARFIIEQGLYVEFVQWWIECRNRDNTEHKIKSQIVKVENEKRRIQGKIAKGQ